MVYLPVVCRNTQKHSSLPGIIEDTEKFVSRIYAKKFKNNNFEFPKNMKKSISILIFLLISISNHAVMAAGDWISVDGPIDKAFTKINFSNPDKISPVVFESGHHEINDCYKISNGFLIFVTSREGLFEGYELNKYSPEEIKNKNLTSVNEVVQNEAGIHLGISKKRVEKLFNKRLNSIETKISYNSMKMIRDIPFDVITSVVIVIENEKLAKLSVITSTTN